MAQPALSGRRAARDVNLGGRLCIAASGFRPDSWMIISNILQDFYNIVVSIVMRAGDEGSRSKRFRYRSVIDFAGMLT